MIDRERIWMLRRFGIGLVLLGAASVPVPAHAATVTIELYNHYFQPTAIVAQAGDTVVLHNLGGRKVVQSYSDDQLQPTSVETNQSISFVFNGTATGLRADDLDPQTPALSTVTNGACSGMCGRVTPTPPANAPQTPVFSSPTSGGSSGNVVLFSGTAANALKVRIKVSSIVRTATVDGTGSWSLQQQLANGAYSATAHAIHPDGFESAPASVSFTVAGGDTQPPRILAGNPATIAGQPSAVRIGTIYAGHGAIKVNGVIIDDVVAKRVAVTIKDVLVPDTEMVVNLTCFNPDAGGATIPCNSVTNPPRIQYTANVLVARPGHYLVTTNAEDATGATSTYVQDVIILSPL